MMFLGKGEVGGSIPLSSTIPHKSPIAQHKQSPKTIWSVAIATRQ